MPQEEPIVIDLDELQIVLERILEHIRIERSISSLPLQANYYWNIDSMRVFDMSHQIDASDIDVGSLHEDWELVRRFVLVENRPLSINLAMISTLLRYVGGAVADLTAADGG
jgi:hypothetical protein